MVNLQVIQWVLEDMQSFFSLHQEKANDLLPLLKKKKESASEDYKFFSKKK